MTQMVEFELAKILERLEQKLDKLTESQIRLEGKVETIGVEQINLQKGQDAINIKINSQFTWLLSIITGLMIGLLGLVAAIGKSVFFPNP